MQELSYMSGEQPLFRQKRSLDDDLAGIGKKRKRSLQDDLAGISGKRSLQDDLAGLNAAVPATPPDILGGTLPSDATNVVVKPYNRSGELMSNLPGQQVPERPWSDAFMPGILPKGTTEKVDRAITNIKPSLFGQQEIPENLSAQEKGRRTMHNIGVKGTKFAPGLLLGALENPIGTAGAVASFLPELAQRLGKAGGVNLKETLLNPTGAPGMPFIPQQTTEQEQKAAQQETLENMFDVILAASPLLGKVKGLRKTGETISKQKTGVKYDKESQGRLAGSERVRQEPRRPIPDKGTGGKAAERGRVLQTQKEVTPSPVKAKESWKMTKEEYEKADEIVVENIKNTVKEFKNIPELERPHAYIGLRFEDKNRRVGETIEGSSKHLPDGREFPVYRSKQYKELEDMGGISTWDVDAIEITSPQPTNYIYVVGSNKIYSNPLADINELILQEPTVLARIERRPYLGFHYNKVESAIRGGKPVPAEVLADYPDLAAKYGKVQNVGKSEQVVTKPPKPVTSAPQSKQKVSGKEPTTLSFMGINPDVAKQTVGTVTTGARVVGGAVKKGSKSISDIMTFAKEAQNQVKHPESKALMKDIERADELSRRREGTATEQLRKTSFKKKRFRKNESGDQLGERIKTGRAPDINRVMTSFLYKVNAIEKKTGVPLTGRVKNYLPRIIKEKYVEKIYNDLAPIIKSLEKGGLADKAIANALIKRKKMGDFHTKDLIDHLLETGEARTYSEAVEIMYHEAAAQIFNLPPHVKHRGLKNLPDLDIYETNARIIIPQYFRRMSKYMAELEVWGKDFSKANKRLQKIQEFDIKEADKARQILDLWSGEYERQHGLKGGIKKLSELVTTAEVVTKIALGTATVPNLVQTLYSTFAELPVKNYVKALVEVAVSPKARSLARESGALTHTPSASMMAETTGKTRKVSNASLTVFNYANKANLYISTISFKNAATSWYKLAQKDSMRGRYARDKLADIGIDYNKPLTNNLLKEKMYRFATDDQLQKNVLKDPTLANHPAFRPFVLFKRFGTKQAVKIKNMMLREFKREGVSKPEALRRTIPAVVKLFIGSQIAGEFTVFVKNEIRTLLSDEDQYRKDKFGTMSRILNNIAAAGSLGLISDISSAGSARGIQNQTVFLLTPVVVSDAYKTLKGICAFAADWGKYGDGGLAFKRQAPKFMGDVGGSLTRYTLERVKTKPQKENRAQYFKGRERTAILDLFIEGDGHGAYRRYSLWNQHHPKDRLTLDDVNFDEIYNRAKEKQETIDKAKGTYIPKSTSDNQGPKAPSPPSAPKGPGR